MCQGGVDRPTLAGQLSERVDLVDRRIEEGGDQGDLAAPEPRCADVLAHLSEHS